MKQKPAENLLVLHTSFQFPVHSIPYHYHCHITNTVVPVWYQDFFSRGGGGATANVSENFFKVLAQNLHHSRIL